jgi:GDP-L-fucose synthase
VCEELACYSPAEIFVPRSAEYDLREPAAIDQLFADARPETVIHLAAAVGGIGAIQANPGAFFYDNAAMGIQLIERSRTWGVGKVVVVGTYCEYSKYCPVPFRENDLWYDYPAEATAPYALAKKMMLVQGQAYRQQYGLNTIHLLPANLYGPHDNFDLESGHVMAALIRKALDARDAGEKSIDVWGTGTASRDFLYVDDAARGVTLATEHYDGAEPVNLGSGEEISIRHLAEMVCRACRFEGELRWDASKPDGQPRRCLETSRAKEAFGFQSEVSLADGIARTIAWYECERSERSLLQAA